MTVARYRAWVLMGVLFAAAVLAALLAGHHPGEVTGVRVRFGADVQLPQATGPLLYTNAWVAAGAGESVGVYAGSQVRNRRNGLFVIVRTTGGSRKLTRVVVRGSGAVTLLRPALPATVQAAFSETLRFVTANGGTGSLDLSANSVSVSG